ncbi:MAG: PilZ domain-containing protein [Pseudobdellovibrio sp.]
MTATTLKKPTGVYILAVLFLFAPLGNIIISFIGSGLSNWYQPSVFISLLQSIPTLDWLWLSLLFLTGLLLFRPHKLSWSLAIVTLTIVLAMNALRLYTVDPNSIDPLFLKIFSVLAILCTLSVLVIAFYFRFPYLDRRSTWVSTQPSADRRNSLRFTEIDRRDTLSVDAKFFNIRTPVTCSGAKAMTESLSETGARISLDQSCQFKKNDIIQLRFSEVSEYDVKATVIEQMEFGARVEFVNASKQFKHDLSHWLKSR